MALHKFDAQAGVREDADAKSEILIVDRGHQFKAEDAGIPTRGVFSIGYLDSEEARSFEEKG